ncbi:MAG: hypothetical protein WKG07_38330 [Hymenobacter sp.]
MAGRAARSAASLKRRAARRLPRLDADAAPAPGTTQQLDGLEPREIRGMAALASRWCTTPTPRWR